MRVKLIEENIITKTEDKIEEFMDRSRETLKTNFSDSNKDFVDMHLEIIEYLLNRNFYQKNK